MERRLLSPRAFIVVGLVVFAIGAVTTYAYGTFVATTTRDLPVSSAVMSLELGNDRLTIDADDMQPGDEVVRAVDIEVGGTSQVYNASLRTDADPSSLLDTDTDDGLQVQVELCDEAWDETLDGLVPVAYDCDGSTTVLVAERPVIFSAQALTGFEHVTGSVNHVLIRLRLPSAATDAMAGESSRIEFIFQAEQRSPSFR